MFKFFRKKRKRNEVQNLRQEFKKTAKKINSKINENQDIDSVSEEIVSAIAEIELDTKEKHAETSNSLV